MIKQTDGSKIKKYIWMRCLSFAFFYCSVAVCYTRILSVCCFVFLLVVFFSSKHHLSPYFSCWWAFVFLHGIFRLQMATPNWLVQLFLRFFFLVLSANREPIEFNSRAKEWEDFVLFLFFLFKNKLYQISNVEIRKKQYYNCLLFLRRMAER